MSLFDNECFCLPISVIRLNISNGAKFLYMFLLNDYFKFGKFATFCPSDYTFIMSVSSRTLYRYFKELLDCGAIYEERGFFKFYYE